METPKSRSLSQRLLSFQPDLALDNLKPKHAQPGLEIRTAAAPGLPGQKGLGARVHRSPKVPSSSSLINPTHSRVSTVNRVTQEVTSVQPNTHACLTRTPSCWCSPGFGHQNSREAPVPQGCRVDTCSRHRSIYTCRARNSECPLRMTDDKRERTTWLHSH